MDARPQAFRTAWFSTPRYRTYARFLLSSNWDTAQFEPPSFIATHTSLPEKTGSMHKRARRKNPWPLLCNRALYLSSSYRC
jgi:hypothetical protein